MSGPRITPFSFRDYRLYWCSRLCANLAQLSMVIVIGWQVYDIARTDLGMSEKQAALQLGIVGIIQFAPMLLFSLYAGWLADRLDRRWIIRSTVSLQLLCALLLATLTASGSINLPSLFFVAALLGTGRAFAGPALTAMASNLVPRDVLPSAIAYGSIAWQTGAIVGPAMGGLLYAVDPALSYEVSAALFAISVGAMFAVGPLRSKPDLSKAAPWRQMVEGLRYVKHNPVVLGALSLDLFAVLLGGATAMLPVYARDVLVVGADGLGQLRAAPSVGAVLVALWFARRPLANQVGPKLLWSVAVFGAATVGFGLSTSMPLSLLMLALLGGADMMSVYIRQSMIQLHTPDAMRGRVGAVSTLFISGSNELGEAESGFLAAAVGPVISVVAGGLGAIAVAGLWVKLFPALVATRRFDVPEPESN